jgi:glycopeptide antibiotics resistance protein
MGFVLSFIIEFLQFAFGVGVSEVDDLILNTLGTYIGFQIFRLLTYMNIKKKVKTEACDAER